MYENICSILSNAKKYTGCLENCGIISRVTILHTYMQYKKKKKSNIFSNNDKKQIITLPMFINIKMNKNGISIHEFGD